MAPISNNPSLVEGIRYSAGTGNIRRVTNTPGRQDTNYNRYKPDNGNKNSVKGKAVNNSNLSNYYRVKYNSSGVPSMYAGLTFDEIEKPLRYNSTQPTSGKSQTHQQASPSSANYNVFENAVGYYIISKPNQAKSESETSNKNKNPMKKKLDRTYHSGEESSTGSLVNIVYY